MKRFWNMVTKGLSRPQPPRTTSPYVTYNLLGKPQWTPRDYQQLADEGYQKMSLFIVVSTLLHED